MWVESQKFHKIFHQVSKWRQSNETHESPHICIQALPLKLTNPWFIKCGYCTNWRITQFHFFLFPRNCFFRILISHLKHEALPKIDLRRKMIISVFKCLPAVSAQYIKDCCQEFRVFFGIFQNKDSIKIITIMYFSIEVGVHMEQDFSTTCISMTILVSCATGA